HAACCNVACANSALCTDLKNDDEQATRSKTAAITHSTSGHHIMHMSAFNVAHDQHNNGLPQENLLSAATFHVSNPMLVKTAQSACRSNHANTSSVDWGDCPRVVQSTSSRASNLIYSESPQSESCQSTDLENVCERPAEICLCRPIVKGNSAQLLSRQNMDVPFNFIHEESSQVEQKSNADLYASDPMLLRTAKSASVQNVDRDTASVLFDGQSGDTEVINANVHAINPMQRLCASEIAYEEKLLPEKRLSNADLHGYNATLGKPGKSSSRESIQKNALSVVRDEPPRDIRLSNASLHSSNPMLTRIQSHSQQSIEQDSYVPYENPAEVIASDKQPENPPMRISMVIF
ncbi:unnamed protein product, partial [Strongylus vulgaris]